MTTQAKPRNGLTGKQALFAQEYLVDRNGTAAAKRAGYGEAGAHVEASHLLRNPKVVAEIERLERPAEAKRKLDQQFVVDKLMHFADNAEVESNAVRATELLGKHLRMFVEVTESTVVHDVQALQEFTVTQLQEMRQAALSAQAEPPIDVDSRELPPTT